MSAGNCLDNHTRTDEKKVNNYVPFLLGQYMSTMVLYCWCHSDSAAALLYFTFLSHLFPLPCGAGSTVPRKGFDSSVIMPFPGVLWLWHFPY